MNLYFDTTFHHIDGGYGDDDWDETERHMITESLVCPVCGKVKKSAIKAYGTLDDVLRVIIGVNVGSIGTDKYLSMVNRLRDDSPEIKRKFLAENGIHLQGNKIKCKDCGKVIYELNENRNIENSTIRDIIAIINRNEIHFCSKCGKALMSVENREKFINNLVSDPLVIQV